MLKVPNPGAFAAQRDGDAMVGCLHVLIVEDDPLVSELVMDALDGVYQTSHVGTAAAAMERLRAGGVDAILLDCTLPGGLDPNLVPLADEAGVPVILMSGHPDMQ